MAEAKENKTSQGTNSFTSKLSEQSRGLSSQLDSPLDDLSYLGWTVFSQYIVHIGYNTFAQVCWLCHVKRTGVVVLAEWASAEGLGSHQHLHTPELHSFYLGRRCYNIAAQLGLRSVMQWLLGDA